MKTPFNNADEQFFNTQGLRRLDFVELPDGWVYAFDMTAIKRGEPMNETNSYKVFRRGSVCPEAFEFLISAPLLYKTLIACQEGLSHVQDAAEHMQGYLKNQKGVSDKTVDFIVKSVNQAQQMIVSAVSVPVVGRDATLKLVQSPLDPTAKPS